ncbi:hypothetical protein CL6EHI_c00149 [Entamoeba histolytica]|uniref:Uncharacterized protein n=1 Tax=Entamoeba histolytica TaxID=5759 RepID=A0A175JYK1_ENTHI|nr:hypothetical protein CL6EHI_c00149 [Entamoeba histolytica]
MEKKERIKESLVISINIINNLALEDRLNKLSKNNAKL